MTRKTPKETRERIVQAAVRRILEHGATPLALGAVAAEAQVSKGGLLHHFPTKVALLEGIATALVGLFESQLEQEFAREAPGAPGRWLRAYIRATFDPDPREPQFTAALARIISAYPEMRAFTSNAFAASLATQARDDGIPAARSLLIRTACDGWWLGELFATPLVTPEERIELRDELLRLTR